MQILILSSNNDPDHYPMWRLGGDPKRARIDLRRSGRHKYLVSVIICAIILLTPSLIPTVTLNTSSTMQRPPIATLTLKSTTSTCTQPSPPAATRPAARALLGLLPVLAILHLVRVTRTLPPPLQVVQLDINAGRDQASDGLCLSAWLWSARSALWFKEDTMSEQFNSCHIYLESYIILSPHHAWILFHGVHVTPISHYESRRRHVAYVVRATFSIDRLAKLWDANEL
jgi:hypothetical protein